jgi:hypothetical protein
MVRPKSRSKSGKAQLKRASAARAPQAGSFRKEILLSIVLPRSLAKEPFNPNLFRILYGDRKLKMSVKRRHSTRNLGTALNPKKGVH